MIETDTNNMKLNELAKGYVRFSIKAEDTEENNTTHEAFKEFCKVECDNNYTLGIRKLLEYIESDYKNEAIWGKIQTMESALIDLKSSIMSMKEQPKEEEEEAF